MRYENNVYGKCVLIGLSKDFTKSKSIILIHYFVNIIIILIVCNIISLRRFLVKNVFKTHTIYFQKT